MIFLCGVLLLLSLSVFHADDDCPVAALWLNITRPQRCVVGTDWFVDSLSLANTHTKVRQKQARRQTNNVRTV